MVDCDLNNGFFFDFNGGCGKCSINCLNCFGNLENCILCLLGIFFNKIGNMMYNCVLFCLECYFLDSVM